MARSLCDKKIASLLWTLLECVFFSGVVLGWSWLALVFRADRYLLSGCNLTLPNPPPLSTPLPSSGSPKAPPHRPPPPRGRWIKRPCRPKTTTPLPGSHVIDDGAGGVRIARDVITPLPVRDEVIDGVAEFKRIAHDDSSTPREEVADDVVELNRFARDVAKGLSRRNDVIDDVAEHVRVAREAVTPPPREREDVNEPHTGNDSRPLLSTSLLTNELSSAPSAEKGVAKDEKEEGLKEEGKEKEGDEEEVCSEQREMLRLLLAVVAVTRDLFVLPVGAFFDKYGTTRTRLLTV